MESGFETSAFAEPVVDSSLWKFARFTVSRAVSISVSDSSDLDESRLKPLKKCLFFPPLQPGNKQNQK